MTPGALGANLGHSYCKGPISLAGTASPGAGAAPACTARLTPERAQQGQQEWGHSPCELAWLGGEHRPRRAGLEGLKPCKLPVQPQGQSLAPAEAGLSRSPRAP